MSECSIEQLTTTQWIVGHRGICRINWLCLPYLGKKRVAFLGYIWRRLDLGCIQTLEDPVPKSESSIYINRMRGERLV